MAERIALALHSFLVSFLFFVPSFLLRLVAPLLLFELSVGILI